MDNIFLRKKCCTTEWNQFCKDRFFSLIGCSVKLKNQVYCLFFLRNFVNQSTNCFLFVYFRKVIVNYQKFFRWVVRPAVFLSCSPVRVSARWTLASAGCTCREVTSSSGRRRRRPRCRSRRPREGRRQRGLWSWRGLCSLNWFAHVRLKMTERKGKGEKVTTNSFT